MKVLSLSLPSGVHELKGESRWIADATTQLVRLPDGSFIVSKYGKHILIQNGAGAIAGVEPQPAPEQSEPAKRGPGRPPKNEQPTT